MSANLRPDPHRYLIVAYGGDDAQDIANFLHTKSWRRILWFNDLNDEDEPPKYRLVVSAKWLERGVEQHDYKQLRDFIAEWERLYPNDVRYVDLADEKKRIDPGPSPLEKKLKGKKGDVAWLDDIYEDNTK